MAPPDLFLTYMNADTARLTTNTVAAHHLNSVHGVYLAADHRDTARDLLPIGSLNSVTLLSAEISGRSYGGGVLKIEPREADSWLMPSSELLESRRESLQKLKPSVHALLRARCIMQAVDLVDNVLFSGLVNDRAQRGVRADQKLLSERRAFRGKSGSRGER
jgi:hypothetical protein